jgi:hypothetical protein
MKIKSYVIINFLIKKFNYKICKDNVINDHRKVVLSNNLNYINNNIFICTNIIIDYDSLIKYEKILIEYKNKKYDFIADY